MKYYHKSVGCSKGISTIAPCREYNYIFMAKISSVLVGLK